MTVYHWVWGACYTIIRTFSTYDRARDAILEKLGHLRTRKGFIIREEPCGFIVPENLENYLKRIPTLTGELAAPDRPASEIIRDSKGD